jgi:glutathione synthase/RimK-type ligase-like ATP-grasp enzyme
MQPRTRVALATAAQAIGLDRDAPLLLAALRSHAVEVELAVWDDPAFDWASWDLTVVRSTWDYPRRPQEFIAWARWVDRVGAVLNAPAVMAWNSDKRYLTELADGGVPIVPSALFAPHEPVQLPTKGSFVVKPAVSAGAQDTARYAASDHAAAQAQARRLQAQGRTVLLQPYLADVDERGETALIYLADRFSHAICKGPILHGAHETVGGLFAREDIEARTPSDAEREVAEQVFDALPFPRRELLYARVDLLPGPDATPLVLEVELVEPSLFLAYCDGAAERFAAAITARL